MPCLSFALSATAAAASPKSASPTLPLTCTPPARAAAFLLSPTLAVTSYHAVRTAREISVAGRPASLSVAGPLTDLALLTLSTALPGPTLALSAPPAPGALLTAAAPAPAASAAPARLCVQHITFELLQPAAARVPLLQLLDLDARVSPGWSGAPVLDARGAVVAVIAQVCGEGLLLAVPARFVERLRAAGKDLPLAFLPGLVTQPLLSPAARRAAHVANAAHGVRVARAAPTSPLRPGDVLTRINGLPVAADGTIAWDASPAVTAHWQAAVCEEPPGASVDVTVIRAGLEKRLRAALRDARGATGAAAWMQGRVVKAGPAVFAALSFELLHGWGPEWLREAPADLVKCALDEKEEGVEEIVVLVGTVEGEDEGAEEEWEEFRHMRVARVDGEAVRGLRDLERDGEMLVEFANGFVAMAPGGEIVEMGFS